jgi:hypothetical protein
MKEMVTLQARKDIRSLSSHGLSPEYRPRPEVRRMIFFRVARQARPPTADGVMRCAGNPNGLGIVALVPSGRGHSSPAQRGGLGDRVDEAFQSAA